MDRHAYAGHYGNAMVCVSLADGSIVWEYRDETHGGPFFSSPAVGDHRVVIGSRDEHLGAHGYCSGVCCTYAIKEAMLAKDHSTEDLDAAIFYIDIRTYGKDFERYYNRAKDEVGVRFVKSKVTNVILCFRVSRYTPSLE